MSGICLTDCEISKARDAPISPATRSGSFFISVIVIDNSASLVIAKNSNSQLVPSQKSKHWHLERSAGILYSMLATESGSAKARWCTSKLMAVCNIGIDLS